MLRLALPCDLNQVRHASQTVHRFLAEQGCGEEILSGCDLALVEACNNAIKYAPDSARATPVGVEVTCSREQLELRVTDHTPGFEWPERAELPPPESESGRGIFLIQSLMDSAHYLRGNGENILVLRKSYLSPGANNGTPPGGRADNDHLVTGLYAERRQREMKARRAVADGERMFSAAVGREFLLELVDIFADRGYPPRIERIENQLLFASSDHRFRDRDKRVGHDCLLDGSNERLEALPLDFLGVAGRYHLVAGAGNA